MTSFGLSQLGLILFEIDPNVVKPGWTPLLITVGLAVAIVLLGISMRRQFRRINVPGDPTDVEPAGPVQPVAPPVEKE